MGRKHNRVVLLALALGAALLVLFLVAASPLALRVGAYFPRLNWMQLANIGQTYGAVSALLAALALLGVALSVLLQVREARHTRIEVVRTRHFELMRVAMDDPLYFQVDVPLLASTDTKRLLYYVNLRLQFWLMLWEFGDLSELELRDHLFNGLFATTIGRYHWEHFGNAKAKKATESKREREFNKILSDEYRRAVVSGPPGTQI